MRKHIYSLPNILTYVRIICVPLVVSCFFIEGPLKTSDLLRWTALFFFSVASVTDFFDGYLARIWKQTTPIGRMLDPIADKLLVSSCLLLLCADRTIYGWSSWAALIILCREILVSGLREYLAELKVIVPVSRLAKWKTFAQMVAIGFLLAATCAPSRCAGPSSCSSATGSRPRAWRTSPPRRASPEPPSSARWAARRTRSSRNICAATTDRAEPGSRRSSRHSGKMRMATQRARASARRKARTKATVRRTTNRGSEEEPRRTTIYFRQYDYGSQ